MIIFGQLLAYIIYIRNLIIEGSWGRFSVFFKFIFIGLPVPILFFAFNTDQLIADFDSNATWLFAVGSVGQLLMSLRFVYQWYVAEKTKSALLPAGFWYITLIASLLILLYAAVRVDPVLLAAQSFSLISSVRNIQLSYKTEKEKVLPPLTDLN